MNVFRLLVRCGTSGMPAGKIAERLAINQTTLSRHLAMMEQVGLVTRERQAQQIFYKVEFDTARELFKYLMEDCCAGDAGVVVDARFSRAGGETDNPVQTYEGIST